MKNPKDRRIHEIKVRFSERELQLAEQAEAEFGICRAEALRDLYMTKIYSLVAKHNSKSSAA